MRSAPLRETIHLSLSNPFSLCLRETLPFSLSNPFSLSFVHLTPDALKRLVLLFFFPLLIPVFSFGQNDSCSLRISLLTCAPGEELYSTFGHTALRVQDPSKGMDQVYNYGTFEFGPDFYTQFIRGKLLYFLSVEEFGDFMYQYEAQSRSVQEQVLRLDCYEKTKITLSSSGECA